MKNKLCGSQGDIVADSRTIYRSNMHCTVPIIFSGVAQTTQYVSLYLADRVSLLLLLAASSVL